VRIGDWHARWVYVSPATNESAMRGHDALVWTTGGHTYAVGFHEFGTRRATRALDVELVGGIRLVRP
jgi:hypothetical protein